MQFAEFNTGNALGVIRSGSADPLCQPSGMFVKANVGSFFLGDALGSIMSGIVPEYEVNVGITLKEGALDRPPALDSIDQVESVFFRAQAQSMSLLGVSIEDPHLEMQYFTKSEAVRRQEWTTERCCSLENVADPSTCGADQTILSDYLEGKLSDETPMIDKPTLAMFFSVPRISFVGGVVQFNDISVQYFAELPSYVGDQATSTLMLSCNARILFIVSIDARAQFSISTDSEGATVLGFFYASTTVNAGPIGKLHVMVDASADVSAFTYNKKSASSRGCLLYTSPSPRDLSTSRMPSSA